MQDDEDAVRVGVHLRYPVAFEAVLDGEAVESEHLRQRPLGVGVAGGDVDPHEAIGPGQQVGDVAHLVSFQSGLGDHVHVRPASMPYRRLRDVDG